MDEDNIKVLQNNHLLNKSKLTSINKYRAIAFISTINIIVGIIFTGIMIFKKNK